MRAYIATHRNEFITSASGSANDSDAASLAPSSGGDDHDHPSSPIDGSAPTLPDGQGKKRDHSAAGPLAPLWDFLEPAFEQLVHQSPKTLLLGAVVVVLVLSNVWTLRSSSSSSGRGSREAHPLSRAGRAAGAEGAEGHHDVAAAVRDVLQDYFAAAGHAKASSEASSSPSSISISSSASPPSPTPSSASHTADSSYTLAVDELQQLEAMLDKVEERVQALRRSLRESPAMEEVDLD
jgi:hypothetical protein